MQEPQQPAVAPDRAIAATEAPAPPTIDGTLSPIPNEPMLDAVLMAGLLLSPAAAVIYGLFLSARPPSALRTAIKVLSVGSLAAIIFLLQVVYSGSTAPEEMYGWPVLAIGFALCALGDGFLAGDPKRWLTPGLFAFLLGHLAFIVLFATLPETQAYGPTVFAAMAAVSLVGAAMLAWLWPALGKMRAPVVAYVVVIVAMVCASLTHWQHNIAWPIGALMFMASDALLAGELFKGAKLPGPPRLTAWAIWFLYYGAQLAFLAGMIGYFDRY